MNKAPLLFTLICFVLYLTLRHFTGEIWISLLVFIPPVGLLITNLALRKNLRYKSWFIRYLGFLLEKKEFTTNSTISTDLLFDKLLEVIQDSEFQLLDADKTSFSLLCGTSVNFWTWGENIYIQLESGEDSTTHLQFVSTNLFGGSSWNRNTNNYSSFINSLEDSLTI